ncbi:MAG: hypothetical protein A2536_05160 [Candidatus Firestonebacteria bacterium RIFOXYD2_FULL_39_29]|nr:MAG: hypothetical protein A2536_05160 [Candidatus Firestonebacteria bacterium RIFOXYD2_FULL_39_29]
MKMIRWFLIVIGIIVLCAGYYIQKVVTPNKIRESEKLVSESKKDLERISALINNEKNADKKLSRENPKQSITTIQADSGLSKMLVFKASYEKQIKDKINNIAMKSFGSKKASVTLAADIAAGLKEEQFSVSYITLNIMVDEKVSDKLISDFKQAVEKEIGFQDNKKRVTITKIPMSFPVKY